jgi:hypothetical protein
MLLCFTVIACSTTGSLNSKDSTICAELNSTDSKVDYEYSETTVSGTTTRKIAVNWETGDKIDIYAGSVSAATKSAPAYTLSAGDGTQSAVFSNGQLQGTLVNGTTPLYAYVEKAGQNIDENNSTVTVDFTNQTGSLADATTRDVLFATSTYYTASNSFSFSHLMSVLRLNITLPEAGNCSIKLENESETEKLYSSVTLDATTGAFKSGVTTTSLSLGKMTAIAGSNAFYLCIYPQTVQDLSALITYENGNHYYVKIQNDSKALEAGKLYTANHTFYAATKYISSTKPKPVTIVVTGADFSDAELAAGGTFETKAKACVDFMFDVEPYKTYKEYFNVYIIPSHSEDIGYVSTSTQNKYTHTIDANKIYAFMKLNCPDYYNYDGDELSIGIIANTDIYYGLTYLYYSGLGIATSTLPKGTLSWAKNNKHIVSYSGDYRNIFLHEFGGHAFGRLDDEYWYDDSKTYPNEAISGHNWAIPIGKNVVSKYEATGTTGYYWEHMIGDTYPKEGKNYEGGAVYGKGVYRPEQVSVMDDNRCYFNAYSRQLIVERILRLAGETFDYNTFVSKDVNVDPTPSTSAIKAASKGKSITIMPPTSPPVLIDR